MIETYVNDEFICYSLAFQLISAYAFYAIVYLLQRQGSSRLGPRQFDQTLVYAIIFMIFAHFMAEQKSLEQYSFIPLKNWHKLINVLLLIEQCSLVLYLGRVSNSISKKMEERMFGLNLILILIF